MLRPDRAPSGLAMLVVLGLACASAADEAPIDLKHARRIFDEARTIGELEGGRLWGVPLHGPIVFVDPPSRFVVTNHADSTGALEARDGVFVGELPAEVGVANTAVEWAGVEWTMLMWPLPEQRYSRRRLLAHEMFHRIQGDLGFPANDPVNTHLDTRDGRTWMRLEWRALREALLRPPERKRAIEDALLFRAARRALFPDKAIDERALELNEGLAEYTGFKASTLPEDVLPDRAAIQLDRYDQRANLVRNFAYASGPAYGLLLDAADAGWRRQLTSESDLGDELARALGVVLPDDPLAHAEQRLDVYDGREVVWSEDAREEERVAQQEKFKSRFQDRPLLRVPPGDSFRYTFNPNTVKAFGDVGTVYLTTRVTDTWGVLEVDSGGALMVREGGRISHVVLPAPADPDAVPLTGDGWMLELSDGWRLTQADNGRDWTLTSQE
jgi:hypothetical protein